MFHEHHHKNIFPLALVGITLTLVLIVGLLYGPTIREQVKIATSGVSEVMVSEADYERNVVRILTQVDERLSVAESNTGKEDVVSTASSELLRLLVPGVYQKLHLEMVITLDTLRQGHGSNDVSKVEEGERRFEDLRAQYSWM